MKADGIKIRGCQEYREGERGWSGVCEGRR